MKLLRPLLVATTLLVAADVACAQSESAAWSWFRFWPFHRKQQEEKTAPAPAPAPAVPAGEDAEAAMDDEFAEFAPPQVFDPLQPFNRAMFKFNDGAYRLVVRPVARGYERVMPEPAREGIGNFFDNLRFPARFAGSVLQLKPKRALRETGKFLVNTTAGLGGFIRVSEEVPALADVPPEDVGQAIGHWGVPHGPYLVLPIFGPTTLRDLGGRIGDAALTPTQWSFLEHYDWKVRSGLQATDAVNSLPGLMDFYDSLKGAAYDPYIAARDGYVQYRNAAVKE